MERLSFSSMYIAIININRYKKWQNSYAKMASISSIHNHYKFYIHDAINKYLSRFFVSYHNDIKCLKAAENLILTTENLGLHTILYFNQLETDATNLTLILLTRLEHVSVAIYFPNLNTLGQEYWEINCMNYVIVKIASYVLPSTNQIDS